MVKGVSLSSPVQPRSEVPLHLLRLVNCLRIAVKPPQSRRRRATMTMTALCDDERIRRKAFHAGLPALLLLNLKEGMTPFAIEGACYCISMLVLLGDRQIFRACVDPIVEMLRSNQPKVKKAALRCVTFMVFTEKEN